MSGKATYRDLASLTLSIKIFGLPQIRMSSEVKLNVHQAAG